ncbi:DUF3530 family protein [Marinomonas sp. 2405UD68-3]|uniref:DUF3530 family protein n=1 Tax=Marinomonas sp. 2405UD68-3 TaxID=3391835 RepID=UPI0039C92400
MIAIKKSSFFLSILLLVGSSMAIFAADEESDTPTPATATPPASNSREAIPLLGPQELRIKALMDSISINRAHEIEIIESPNDRFLSLFRESTAGEPQGCIMLIHGDNEHPDWPQVISPIRNTLIENSWCTLSIEIPDTTKRFELPTLPTINNTQENTTNQTEQETKSLPNEEIIYSRMDSARQHLSDKGYRRVIFLGHGTGAAYALKYVVDQGISGSALAIIDPFTPLPFNDFEMANLIESLRLPVLDYYFNSNIKQYRAAQYRMSASKKRLSTANAYIQIKAPPDRRYDSISEKRLTQRVWGFLKQNTHQMTQTRPLPTLEKGLFSEDPIKK